MTSTRTSRRLSIPAILALVLAAPAAARQLQPFTEEAAARGIDYTSIYRAGAGQGMAFADLDDDGDPDFIATGRIDGEVGVFRNDGGTFTMLKGTGVPPFDVSVAVSAADYDGDGDLDLFFGLWGEPNRLLRNDGGFTFTDVSAVLNLSDTGQTTAGAWADVNGDDRLDLHVSNLTNPLYPAPNRLYIQQPDGSMLESAGAYGVDNGDLTWQGLFLDHDLDGDPDLYVSNDKGAADCTNHNFLFENVDGAFVDITYAAGVEACADSMGVAVGDFDANGHPDIYCTNTPSGNPLLLNLGDKNFIEASVPAGVASYEIGWGTVLLDFDHDGTLDLFVCNQWAPNRLYRHEGAWPCTNQASALEVDTGGVSYCVVTADVDADGDLDLAVQNTDEPIRLFINHEGQRRNWVKFDVVGRGLNRDAVGAVVHATAGGWSQFREVCAGHQFRSNNDMTLHFGMGDVSVLDSIDVTWPGGDVRSLSGYRTNARWTLHPPERLGDVDGDGQHDADDFARLWTCFGGPVSAGCEVMDLDGDADIDLDDATLFVALYDAPADCNGNSQDDLLDVLVGTSANVNNNAIPDECEVVGDLDGSGGVDVADLLLVLAWWGGPGPDGDANNDGIVDVADLLLVLAEWT
ncbi:MAG: FG-GAP-like repeat-containing protein [Planctomycetota bacterium]|jgi:hypothetical protein